MLLLVVALVAAGWYWRSNADERAVSRYHKQLPAAEAAWPATVQWLSSVQPPEGWQSDATFSACGFERVPVVCFETPYDDPAQAASAAQRWLLAAGAVTKDPLMNTFLASVRAHRGDVLGCTSVAGLCTGDVSWHGSSVGIRALTGERSVGQHVSVAIGRGYGFPEANEPPAPRAVLLGKTPADLATTDRSGCHLRDPAVHLAYDWKLHALVPAPVDAAEPQPTRGISWPVPSRRTASGLPMSRTGTTATSSTSSPIAT